MSSDPRIEIHGPACSPRPPGTRRPAGRTPARPGHRSGVWLTAEEERTSALRPKIMDLCPIPAITAVLNAAGMTITDMDAIEMNEAFAAQVVPCRDELGIDPAKLNIHGGAIALVEVLGPLAGPAEAALAGGLVVARAWPADEAR